MIRVAFDEMLKTTVAALALRGFSPERAGICARLFCEASLDGVYTHGLARFPRFIAYIEAGRVIPGAEPDGICCGAPQNGQKLETSAMSL